MSMTLTYKTTDNGSMPNFILNNLGFLPPRGIHDFLCTFGNRASIFFQLKVLTCCQLAEWRLGGLSWHRRNTFSNGKATLSISYWKEMTRWVKSRIRVGWALTRPLPGTERSKVKKKFKAFSRKIILYYKNMSDGSTNSN
jgi:hypothetical protein